MCACVRHHHINIQPSPAKNIKHCGQTATGIIITIITIIIIIITTVRLLDKVPRPAVEEDLIGNHTTSRFVPPPPQPPPPPAPPPSTKSLPPSLSPPFVVAAPSNSPCHPKQTSTESVLLLIHSCLTKAPSRDAGIMLTTRLSSQVARRPISRQSVKIVCQKTRMFR